MLLFRIAGPHLKRTNGIGIKAKVMNANILVAQAMPRLLYTVSISVQQRRIQMKERMSLAVTEMMLTLNCEERECWG